MSFNSESNQEVSLRVSRDEMNLAEFPLAVLSTRADPKSKTLEFSDSIIGKAGKPMKRSWIITAADKFGLPTSSDDEVLLGLMKLTVDDGFREQKVFFTRYELLKILRWTTEGRSYSRLQKALDRLSGVRIKATNAFFDNQTKSHSTKNFGIIDAYEINDARDPDIKKSFFIWSEELFNSFTVGFIKKLDLDFYLNLKFAVSKRLFRYLDKNFWYKSKLKINLFTLAHEKIGISRNYKYASAIKQQIDQGLNELVEKNFLESYEYLGKGNATEIILVAKKLLANNTDTSSLVTDDLAKELVNRGLKEYQLPKLIGKIDQQTKDRINKIIKYYDQLIAKQSPLVSISPVGFLFSAVSKPFAFNLPGEQKIAKEKPIDKNEENYNEFVAQELEQIRSDLEPKLLEKIVNEAEVTLGNMKKLVSDKRFAESVQHSVNEKLMKLFIIPSFEEWKTSKITE